MFVAQRETMSGSTPAPNTIKSPPVSSRVRIDKEALKKWAFVAVPALALLELALHAWQTTVGIVPEADWKAAREVVKAKVQPDDLVIFAPTWTDPLGREYFGDEIASLSREAFPDVTRFPRAFEVSIRGKHRAELEGWRETGRESVGKITITTLENPSPIKVIDDLVRHATAAGMSVQRVDGERATQCPFVQAGAQTGALGFGPGVPSERFVCPNGGFVGVSVLQPIDHTARRCFYAPPPGGESVIRLRFANVRFGKALHGHHGIHWHQERGGTPVTLVWKADGKVIGRVVHNDGDAWKGFELDTRELEDKTGELIAEVTSPNAARRQYCFEADTR